MAMDTRVGEKGGGKRNVRRDLKRKQLWTLIGKQKKEKTQKKIHEKGTTSFLERRGTGGPGGVGLQSSGGSRPEGGWDPTRLWGWVVEVRKHKGVDKNRAKVFLQDLEHGGKGEIGKCGATPCRRPKKE